MLGIHCVHKFINSREHVGTSSPHSWTTYVRKHTIDRILNWNTQLSVGNLLAINTILNHQPIYTDHNSTRLNITSFPSTMPNNVGGHARRYYSVIKDIKNETL